MDQRKTLGTNQGERVTQPPKVLESTRCISEFPWTSPWSTSLDDHVRELRESPVSETRVCPPSSPLAPASPKGQGRKPGSPDGPKLESPPT